MNVELEPEELQLIIGALDDKHKANANSGSEVLPELQAVNRLYDRLSELSEDYEKGRLEIFAKGLAREALRRAAQIKEYGGQVKTLEDSKRLERSAPLLVTARGEIEGEAAIKLYDELVKSPEDRQALEREIPSLIAARDEAVTAAKRKQLQTETFQTAEQGHLSI